MSSDVIVGGMVTGIVRSVYEELELDPIKCKNEQTWPNPLLLQVIQEKYAKNYEFDVFRKEMLPNLYPELFDLFFNRKDKQLEAVFKLKEQGLVKGIHEEVSSPIYLRKFSEVFFPYINRGIDAILGYFGTSYEEHVEKYQRAIESDQKISDLVAFEYSQWETFTWYDGDGGEIEGYDCLKTYYCDMSTMKKSSKY